MPRVRPLGPNPQDRPNWDSMNEGQRRYAMEQWNLARVRRGERFDPPGDDDHVMNEQDAIDDFDLDLLGSPQEEHTPSQQSEDGVDDFLQQVRDRQEAGPSNAPDMSDVEMSQVSSSQGSKRSSSSGGGRASKVPKSGTSLPGTGGNLDGMSSGGSAAGGSPAILRPIGLHVEKMTKTYHKKHRFLTSANANVIIKEAASGTSPKRFALTTGLASIPWEYLFMYMSPAEYNRMKQYPGTCAVSASVTVKAWNTRVAFQTGDTQTANATLNQNKFLQVAQGMRSIPYIVSNNRRYQFSATEPMLPTGFTSQTSEQYREGLKTAIYGYDNNSPNFIQAPPANATGAEIYLQDYLTVYTLDASGTGDDTTYLPGFPPYKDFIEEFDASACVNGVVATMNYDFQYAPLVPNYAAVPNNLIASTGNQDIPIGTNIEVAGQKTVTMAQTTTPSQTYNHTRKFLQGPNSNSLYFTEEQAYFKRPMEQGGVFEETNNQSLGDSQMPSLNVGIRAVPKLTTSDNTTQANSWLDAQGYFEVDCTLVTESVDPYTYIKQGCYASNTTQQMQWYSDAAATGRPIAKTYDLPNVYGRMRVNNTS
nr:MAG: structural protein [Canine parvovirus]